MLDYAEFAHFYEGSPKSDAERHAHFETFASIMDCIARYYWQESQSDNRLGITFDDDTLALIGTLESPRSLPTIFNDAASDEAAGKKEP